MTRYYVHTSDVTVFSFAVVVVVYVVINLNEYKERHYVVIMN